MLLQYIRDRATGWVAWGIVTLIIIPFALWGIYDYFSPSARLAAASVNGVEISLQRFNQLYQQQRYQMQALLGAAYRPDLLDEDLLRRRAIDDLVEDEIVIQAGVSQGMRIGDLQLATSIEELPAFQGESGFSQSAYEQWLRARGYSPPGFEFDFRRSLLTQQLGNAVTTGALVTARDLREHRRLSLQKRTVRTLYLPASKYLEEEVDEQAIIDHYESNRASYVTPEQVRVEYLEISRERIAEAIPIDDSDLHELYDARKATMTTPEQREASHILIALDSQADDAVVNAATEKLTGLAAQMLAGAAFEDLAKAHSEDPGSAQGGGGLGWFGRDIMDPNFEAAAFSLTEGEISEPVRSSFGLHLIKVSAVRESRTKSFDEARDELVAEYQDEQAEKIFVDRAEQLFNLSFEHPDSLDEAAEALELAPKRTEFFSRNDDDAVGLPANSRFVEAAFGPDVLVEGNNSELIELDDARVVVLRIAQRSEAAPRALEEVHEEIAQTLSTRAAGERAREIGSGLVKRLRGGADAEPVAGELGLTWNDSLELARRSTALDPQILDTAFRMPRPAAAAVTYDGIEASNGDYVIVALQTVADGDSAGDLEDETRTQVSRAIGQGDYDALVRTLRARADVVVFDDNLQ